MPAQAGIQARGSNRLSPYDGTSVVSTRILRAHAFTHEAPSSQCWLLIKSSFIAFSTAPNPNAGLAYPTKHKSPTNPHTSFRYQGADQFCFCRRIQLEKIVDQFLDFFAGERV